MLKKSLIISVFWALFTACGALPEVDSTTKATSQDGVTGLLVDLAPFINAKEMCERNSPPPDFEIAWCGKSSGRTSTYWQILPYASEKNMYWETRRRKNLVLRNITLRYVDNIITSHSVPADYHTGSRIELTTRATFPDPPVRIVNPVALETSIIVDHDRNRFFDWDMVFDSGKLTTVKVIATSLANPTVKQELFSDSFTTSYMRNPPPGVWRRPIGKFNAKGRVVVPFPAEVRLTVQIFRDPGSGVGALKCGDDPALRDHPDCGFYGEGLLDIFSAKFFGSQCVPDVSSGRCI